MNIYNTDKDRNEGKDEIMSNVHLQKAQEALFEALSNRSASHVKMEDMVHMVKQFRDKFELSNDAWAEVLSLALQYNDWNMASLFIDEAPGIEPIKILGMVMDTGNEYFLRYFLEENDFLKKLHDTEWMQILQKGVDTDDLDILQQLLDKAPIDIIVETLNTGNEKIINAVYRAASEEVIEMAMECNAGRVNDLL
jgi:hypothetical protein